jgi:hypothetical protein
MLATLDQSLNELDQPIEQCWSGLNGSIGTRGYVCHYMKQPQRPAFSLAFQSGHSSDATEEPSESAESIQHIILRSLFPTVT